MNLTKITDQYFVFGQIQPNDVSILKEMGFGTIICNRPDGESPGQPTAKEIGAKVESEGMKFFYVPFAPMSPAPNMLEDFCNAMQQAQGKILAYCRTGNRSTQLYNRTQL